MDISGRDTIAEWTRDGHWIDVGFIFLIEVKIPACNLRKS